MCAQFGWPHSFVPIGTPAEGLTHNFSAQFQTGAASSRPGHKRAVRAAAALMRGAQLARTLALTSGALNATAAATAAATVAATSREDTSHEDPFHVAWDMLGIMQVPTYLPTHFFYY